MKKFNYFRPTLKSRHPSHEVLRRKNKKLPLFNFKSVIRLGSTTEMDDTVTSGGSRIEVNTVEAIKNASNKIKMKGLFTENNVKTADWWVYEGNNLFTIKHTNEEDPENTHTSIENLPYPIVSKHKYGSRGTGNVKHDNAEELQEWMNSHRDTLDRYIFEKFYNFVREYRLHVTKDGCFYTCRKMLRRDTPEEDRWYRNDDHCVWILEENELFDKPTNWDEIVEHSVRALNAVGLDVGAVDVKVQGATNSRGNRRENPKFIVLEINSAPSFGSITEEKYVEELPKILMNKYNEQ